MNIEIDTFRNQSTSSSPNSSREVSIYFNTFSIAYAD